MSILGAILAGGLAARLGGAVADPSALLVAGTAVTLDPALTERFHVSLAAAMHDVFLVSLVVTLFGIAAAFGMTGWRRVGPTS